MTFRDNEADIYYFEKYLEGCLNESSGTEGVGKSMTVSRLTEEMTVLSSVHGRSRRHLRDISKHDLKAAVKYGVKLPGHRCPRTKERRWKFIYNNVVYITDSTCRTEVTSYKEAVEIQPASITPKMKEQHLKVAQILQDDPHLLTTHSILIIDQSGSMRISDVNGFRTRSEAAYGCLALDYVAEQLYDRGDELFVDAVTIIEMNDNGTIFIEREPLDWVLFNKLLTRQGEAKPRSHGNYVNSLNLAKSIIERELISLDELDPDDFPAYMLVFLSDGKPSDKSCSDEYNRQLLVRSLTEKLGQKLTFCAMGLGASGADFVALKKMVDTATDHGAEGTFNHAGLSSAELSSLFSSMSSAMTSTRTELLTSDKDASGKKEEKVYTMRNNETPLKVWPSKRHIISVSSYRFDSGLYKRREYPWRNVPLKTKVSVGFEVEESAFGKGAERLAYRFYKIRRDNSMHGFQRVGKMMVAKESRFIEDEGRKENFHLQFCRVQHKASELAIEFNKAVKKSPTLRLSEEECSKPSEIHFLKCQVYEFVTLNGVNSGLLVENFLKGKFTKYTGNDGYVRNISGPTIDLIAGTVYLEEFCMPFPTLSMFAAVIRWLFVICKAS